MERTPEKILTTFDCSVIIIPECMFDKSNRLREKDFTSTGIDYSKIGLSDNFMFGSIMQEPKYCKPFLEQILNLKIEHIEYVEREKDIKNTRISHSIRLDIYVDDGKTIYNCEMQSTDKKNLPKRSRYYQGQIDLNLLKPGENYNKLKKCFVIFICTFDVFGEDRYIYTFENRCKQNMNLLLGDDAIKIFINTTGHEGDVSEDFKELMHFIDTAEKKEYNNELVKELAGAVERTRSSEEWRHDYMTWTQLENEIREEGRAEGRAEGRTEGIIEEVYSSVYENDYSAERGAEKLNVTITVFLSQYEQWKKDNQKE